MADGDLTDLASVKAWLGLPGEAGASDGLLSALISGASDFIGAYLNRSLLSADYVEVYDGNGAAWMLLRQAPITAVASVAFGGLTLSTPADPVTGAPGLMFDGRRLSLLGHRFPHGAPVVVSYTAGYATPPPAIQQAVNELVGEAFRRRDRIGQTSRTLGGQETLDIALANALNDTASVANRQTAPSSGVGAWSSGAAPQTIAVPSPGALPPGAAPNAAGAQAVWLRLTLAAGQAPAKTGFTLRATGATT